MTPAQLRSDPWATGPFCFVVAEVRLFERPVPCRGLQGFWPTTPKGQIGRSALARALADLAGVRVPSALTLQQPYAMAIAAGVKTVENRTWRREIPEAGLWTGLHAGKTLYGSPERSALLVRLWRRPPSEQHLWPEVPLWPDCPPLEQLPRGVMLGVMRISACLPYPTEQLDLAGGARG